MTQGMFQRIHSYLEKSSPESPPILREMEAHAAEQKFPIVGPLVGRFLQQAATMVKARKILELGSGFGYSAYWFSLSARGRGHITMTDLDRLNKRRAFDYFKRAGLQSTFDFRTGDAIKIADKLEGPFDLVFNDIDKHDYPRTIDLAAGLLRKGGLFITDNVVWSGRVCDRTPDATTNRIIEFTEQLYRDSRFFTTVIPLRDGLSLAVRV